jgi:glycerol-3-phosphate dehydrogenase (NAD(P)+)
MSDVYDIGVLGAGAWGTALAVLHARAGRRVALWSRDPDRGAAMGAARRNPRLPEVTLPDGLDIAIELPQARILLLAAPMQNLRDLLIRLPRGSTPLVLCCKGLETGTALLPPELAAALHPGRPASVLTGPNFAHEISSGLPAASVLASEDPAFRADLMAALSTPTLRLYGSADTTGAALGGAAKNVIAIAAGVVMGAGLGENARAALVTRGLAEIARLAVALGGRAETISGLSGLGDLLLTCTGGGSRNFSLGVELGRGRTLADIMQGRAGVTEGIATAPALRARAAAARTDMPVIEAVSDLLSGAADTAQTMAALMNRALRNE